MDDLNVLLADFIAARDVAAQAAAQLAQAQAAAQAANDANLTATQTRDNARRTLIDAINRA